MAHSVPFPAQVAAGERSAAASVSWPIWCSVIGVTSAIFGVHWDISWHQSIGRDTFWSAPHIAIYLSGILAGVACAYLILSATFGASEAARETSVGLWGFRGPLGAFVCAWGGFAMLASAPFDDWWHNAYGLDVKILSPPHMVLGLGIGAIRFGVMILVLGAMNRAAGKLRAALDWLFLYVGSLWVVGLTVLLMEHTYRSVMHGAKFYALLALTIPIILAAFSRASASRWAATKVTAMYSAFLLALLWILPLFPAEPKLGPVFQSVARFVPPEFPLLLVAPALVLDCFWARAGGWSKWRQAAVAGALFVVVFAAVQWPFAGFLMTPAARNWFFGTQHFAYFIEADSAYALFRFEVVEQTAGEFWRVMALAVGVAIVTTRAGLGIGDWMRRLRR